MSEITPLAFGRDRRAILVAIGQRMRKARLCLDMTQAEVAAALHIGEERYSSYEQGRHPMPYDVLFRLSIVLRQPVGFFLGLQGDRGLSDEEQLVVNIYRSIQAPDVREAVRRILIAQAAVDQQLRRAAGAIGTAHE